MAVADFYGNGTLQDYASIMENRVAYRQRVLKAATMEFVGGRIACMVKNISDTGAMLDVATQFTVPDRFWLVLMTERKRFQCRLIWQNERLIGVAFE